MLAQENIDTAAIQRNKEGDCWKEAKIKNLTAEMRTNEGRSVGNQNDQRRNGCYQNLSLRRILRSIAKGEGYGGCSRCQFRTGKESNGSGAGAMDKQLIDKSVGQNQRNVGNY